MRGLQLVVADALKARDELMSRGVECSDIQQFSPDDMRRVAAEYLSADRCATLVVLPKEESDDEGDDEEVRDAA